MTVSPTRFGSSAPGLTYFKFTSLKALRFRNLLRGLAIRFSKTEPCCPACDRLPDCAFYNRPQTTQLPGASLRRPVVSLIEGARCVPPQRHGVKRLSDAAPRARIRTIFPSSGQAQIGSERSASRPAALRAHDRFQVAESAVQIVVHHPVLVAGQPRQSDLDLRGVEPAPNGRVIVGRARAQPPLQLGERGRQDESAHRIRMLLLDRLASLHVDVEDHQALGVVDRAARRSVMVAVHLRPFHERAFADHLLEPLFADEVVIDAVLLVPAGRARRVADGEDRSGVRRDQAARERGLPGPRRRAEDEQEGLHSTFWTCSRMRSSSAFSSTTVAAMPACCDLEPMVLISRLSSWTRNSSFRPAGACDEISPRAWAR